MDCLLWVGWRDSIGGFLEVRMSGDPVVARCGNGMVKFAGFRIGAMALA